MRACLKLSSFLKASDGKGGQSEGVIDLAGVARLCSGLCFSSRAVAALGLPLKVQENTEVSSCGVYVYCECACVITRGQRVLVIWMNLCHLWSMHTASLIINAFPWAGMHFHANTNLINQVMLLQ